MAKYESIEFCKISLVGKAKERLLHKSNYNDSQNSLDPVLFSLFENAYEIIISWRKLKNDDEFLNGKWDSQIKDYIINGYNTLNDEMVSTTNVGGIGKTYRATAEDILKSKVPQKLF